MCVLHSCFHSPGLGELFLCLCFSDLEGFLNEFADIGKEDSPSIEELFSVCCVSVI